MQGLKPCGINDAISARWQNQLPFTLGSSFFYWKGHPLLLFLPTSKVSSTSLAATWFLSVQSPEKIIYIYTSDQAVDMCLLLVHTRSFYLSSVHSFPDNSTHFLFPWSLGAYSISFAFVIKKMGIFEENVSGLKVLDCALRLFLVPFSIAAIWLTLTNHQDNSSYGELVSSYFMGLK